MNNTESELYFKERAAQIAFVIIFPGFILYQTLVSRGDIGPIFGGYFTFGVVIAIPLILYSYVNTHRPCAISLELTFAVYIMVFFTVVLNGSISGVDTEILLTHYSVLAKSILLMLMAYALPWTNRKHSSFIRLIFVLLSGITIYQYILGDTTYLALIGNSEDLQLDYQGLAFAYVVLLLSSISNTQVSQRLFLYLLSIVVLYVIGARSEFVAMLLLAIVIEVTRTKKSISLAMKVGIAILTVSAFVIQYDGELGEDRMLALLDMESDLSVIERQRTLLDAISTIKENPLFGGYGSYQPGEYAHNIISAWVDMGIIGFILLLALTILPIIHTALNHKMYSADWIFSICLAALCTTSFLIFFAKHYAYPMMPISLGIYFRMRHLGISRNAYLQDEYSA